MWRGGLCVGRWRWRWGRPRVERRGVRCGGVGGGRVTTCNRAMGRWSQGGGDGRGSHGGGSGGALGGAGQGQNATFLPMETGGGGGMGAWFGVGCCAGARAAGHAGVRVPWFASVPPPSSAHASVCHTTLGTQPRGTATWPPPLPYAFANGKRGGGGGRRGRSLSTTEADRRDGRPQRCGCRLPLMTRTAVTGVPSRRPLPRQSTWRIVCRGPVGGCSRPMGRRGAHGGVSPRGAIPAVRVRTVVGRGLAGRCFHSAARQRAAYRGGHRGGGGRAAH